MSSPKPGDVVRLASGGPKMTVNMRAKAGGPFECLWFVNDELRQGNFADEALVAADGTSDLTTTPPPAAFPPP